MQHQSSADRRDVHPEVAAGDPFIAAASRTRDEDRPHGCIDGWVYFGFEGEDENGEHVEKIERMPCRRCAEDR